MKSFKWRIAICVVPVLLAAWAVSRAFYLYEQGRGGFKLGVDLVGGTILVYEVDPDKKQQDNYEPQQLAAALKRRIDPADLYNVTIRPVSTTRVEIILPTGGKHQAEVERQAWDELIEQVKQEWPVLQDTELNVQRGHVNELVQRINEQFQTAKVEVKLEDIETFINARYKESQERRHLTGEEVANVKELISRQGSLEFRILANERDDKDAIDAAKQVFKDAEKDPKLKQELDNRAIAGKAPLGPTPPDGQSFKTPLGDFTYSWVELGRSERQTLGLDNAAKDDPTRASFWNTVAEARKKGETVPIAHMGGALLFSREYVVPRKPEADRNKQFEYFLLTRDPERGKAVTGEYLTSAGDTQDSKMRPAVRFNFNTKGGDLFYDLTSKNAPASETEGGFHRYLAIVLDGQIMSAPSLNARIRDSGIIEGRFTKVEIDRLVNIFRSGALPATLKPLPVSENTIGATLGDDTIRAGAYSVLIAFGAILLFMLAYYRFSGLVACIALMANLLLTVAFMVMVNATFTLPGLAGLVLMLGMAVDANVLIYERLREERDRGASLALAIRNGYDRAFPTIIDTHLSSIFTAIVLYVVGNDQLKGFGISLTAGLIISLFTSLFMTRLLFDLWLAKGWLHKLSMFRLLSKTNIDFMRLRRVMFTATVVISIVGVAIFLMRGQQGLNIDFVGGTAYGGQLAKQVDVTELRSRFSEERQRDALAVKEVKQLDTDGRAFEIVYADGATRKINVPNTMTTDQVAQQAKLLPDLSVEQIFTPTFSEGNKSSLFTIRTSEKSPELVQASIDRLLGDLQKKITMNFTYPAGDAKHAALEFTDPSTNLPVYASPAQVSSLLEREFKNRGLEAQAQRFTLVGKGKEEQDRYQKMELALGANVDATQVKSILEDTQKEFAARPQPERLENFDSQLAAETQLRALYAILASWGAILLYLWFRFGSWTFGAAAVLCLIHDLCFTLGAIAFCHYIHELAPGVATVLGLQDFKIDLPAVAALLTLVGYSVSDTIVVFDRIREVRGKNPDLTPQTINDSVNQTLSRTLLTALSVWLVVIVLYIFGGEGVHLFAFVMVAGVIVGTYSSIYIASPLLLIFGEGKREAKARQQRQLEPAGAGV
jgi:SecD/SecF fusion protein